MYEKNFEGHTAYLCGPPVMIEDCIKTLIMGRLFEKNIFTEKFLTAKDGETKSRSPVFRGLQCFCDTLRVLKEYY